MLKGLSRYIFVQALGPFVVATVVLTGIIWLTQALRMLDVMITQGQTLVAFFQLTALALPSTLIIVLPISLFCALLYTLHKLIADSEIVVMFSAGVSLWAVAKPILAIAMAVSFIVLSFSVYIAPAGMRELKSRIYDIRTDVTSSMIREGTFTNPTTGLTVYVRERAPDGTTHGVLVHDSRNPNEPITYMAETGSMVQGPRGPLLVMFNGNIQRVSRDEAKERGAATLLFFDKYTFDLSPYLKNQPALVYEGRERYFNELVNPSADDTYGQSHRNKLLADAHERLAEGIFPMALALIALAALLPAPFNRRGYAMRMAAAAGAALVLRVAGFALANTSKNDLSIVPLVYLVPLAACAISLAIVGGVRFGPILQRLPLPRLPGSGARS
ncbi:LPS export ABC transporter permease LptF [Parvibaculum sp.]|uniref:LPS export ABC transporter permease LptF n=1 Tax=Parvibaculum sp. TaxID=2024848 RepID=UPI001DBDABD0|nr:LPS export ABC transporter permease LptF [Parvibaculum sp.]MBX3491072.1 LPS export ABC transporter permease LptF [Parvibaculum sp.]MCW5728892.1 LPS export ABC transporter permease LptF [Parvibaculum sp.]